MDLDRLYCIADKENIALFAIKIKNKAITCEINGDYYIGLNFKSFNSSIEEKETLAEELRTLLL